MVRIDKALGTSKAVFCFFTLLMQETGTTTCKNTHKEKVRLASVESHNELKRMMGEVWADNYLSVLKQNRRKETGMRVSDV